MEQKLLDNLFGFFEHSQHLLDQALRLSARFGNYQKVFAQRSDFCEDYQKLPNEMLCLSIQRGNLLLK